MTIAPAHQNAPAEERRKNIELRIAVDFISEIESETAANAWDRIEDEYQLTQKILHDGRDISVSDELIKTFDTNYRVISGLYNPDHDSKPALAQPLKTYLGKLRKLADRILHRSDSSHGEMAAPLVREKIREFLREYVIHLLQDSRVVLFLLGTIIHRRLLDRDTATYKKEAEKLLARFGEHHLRADKLLTLLIYNLCQASVTAIHAADHSTGSRFCEKAVEMFKLLPEDSKVKEAIRGQIEEALRITTERLVQRVQEMPEHDQVSIIEGVIQELSNMDLIAYLLPQLVFFLIRAQKYADCLQHLDRILGREDLSRTFLNYQTAITITHEWCDSLLKAERYSRGQVSFSFIQQQKDNIDRVFSFAIDIHVPEIEDETFYNYEIERLAVTFSHLGTLFFVTGNVEKATRAYEKSFATISLKKIARNRNSMDEIMDRYKDTIHHPLNSAPIEAHSLIATLASERGYDLLLDAQLERYAKENIPYEMDDQCFATLENPQKEMISDLIDSVGSKLKVRFGATFAPYRPFIEARYQDVRKKMRI